MSFWGGSRMGNKRQLCEGSSFICAVAPCALIANALTYREK